MYFLPRITKSRHELPFPDPSLGLFAQVRPLFNDIDGTDEPNLQAVCFKLKINHYGSDLYKVLRRMWNIIFYIQWERRAPPIWCH